MDVRHCFFEKEKAREHSMEANPLFFAKSWDYGLTGFVQTRQKNGRFRLMQKGWGQPLTDWAK